VIDLFVVLLVTNK